MGKDPMKELVDDVAYSSEVLTYVITNADKLNPFDAIILSAELIKFSKAVENLYFKLKRENGETKTTEIKFEE